MEVKKYYFFLVWILYKQFMFIMSILNISPRTHVQEFL